MTVLSRSILELALEELDGRLRVLFLDPSARLSLPHQFRDKRIRSYQDKKEQGEYDGEVDLA